MTQKQRVLFICVHNSARSQMAEAYLHALAPERFEAESAGLEPGVINPLVVQVMAEEGIDLSGKKTNGVFEFYRQGRRYDYVVAVCSKEAEERCPFFPGVTRRLRWPFEDPSRAQGTHEEKLRRVRRIRDQIKRKVVELIASGEVSDSSLTKP
jgi:arsenate reductase